jgi:coenzyme F420-reducing hydrogenase beta subunit
MSTSGGVFSEFAKQILAEGGVCYGAAYDKDFTIRHTRIDKVEDLPKIRQSKYYQSRIGDSYRQVKKDLEAGLKVMFCGAPCQANGLSAYLKKDYDNLFIVDFICHSVSSEKAFKAYLRELESVYKSKASNIWFKNKANGWHKFGTRIDFENKEEYYLRPWPEDYYMRGFLTYRCFQRPSCHNCSFKEYKRSADVTLADFWGLKWNNPNVTDDQENGVSIVMIHTQKAENLFKNFVSKNMYYEEHKIDEIPPKNGGLFSCQRVGLYRDFFFENVDKVPYSAIISSMAKREANIKAEKERAQKNNIKKP